VRAHHTKDIEEKDWFHHFPQQLSWLAWFAPQQDRLTTRAGNVVLRKERW